MLPNAPQQYCFVFLSTVTKPKAKHGHLSMWVWSDHTHVCISYNLTFFLPHFIIYINIFTDTNRFYKVKNCITNNNTIYHVLPGKPMQHIGNGCTITSYHLPTLDYRKHQAQCAEHLCCTKCSPFHTECQQPHTQRRNKHLPYVREKNKRISLYHTIWLIQH